MSNQPKKRRPPHKKERPEPDFFEVLRQGGTQALQSGQLGTALELLEHAHQLQPHNNDVILNLSGAYILTKKFKKAVNLLEPLSQHDPENPMVWTNLGAAYLGNPILANDEDQLKAIATFKKAIDLNPKAPNVAYNIGLIYRDRQETATALHWFNRALKANPQDKDARRFAEKLSPPDEGAENL